MKLKLIRFVKGIRNFWTPSITYRFQGADRADSFVFQYVGWDYKLRSYWLRRLSIDYGVAGKKKSYIPGSRSDRKLNRNRGSVDLQLMESAKVPGREEEGERAYLLPRWMEMEIDTGPPSNKGLVKEMKRRIKKYALEHEFRSEKKDFDLFYFRMYKPLLTKNHGSSADLGSYKLFSGSFLRGEAVLLFLLSQGKPAAAQLIERRGDAYRILAFGILDASQEIQKMGVHGVLYYLAMEHYKRMNQSTLLCGSSSPVALDGVTQFKLRLGARPFLKDLEERQKYQFILKSRNPSLFKALANNPIYYISEAGLCCVVFARSADIQEQADLLQIIKKVRNSQLKKIELLLQDPVNGIDDWLPGLQEPTIEYSIINYELDQAN